MSILRDGEVYEDPNTGCRFVVTDGVDTFGVPTHEAEYMTVEMETVEDGDWYGFDYEKVRSWPKVADDVSELDH